MMRWDRILVEVFLLATLLPPIGEGASGAVFEFEVDLENATNVNDHTVDIPLDQTLFLLSESHTFHFTFLTSQSIRAMVANSPGDDLLITFYTGGPAGELAVEDFSLDEDFHWRMDAALFASGAMIGSAFEFGGPAFPGDPGSQGNSGLGGAFVSIDASSEMSPPTPNPEFDAIDVEFTDFPFPYAGSDRAVLDGITISVRNGGRVEIVTNSDTNPSDFDGDGDVDGDDFLTWQAAFGVNDDGDADDDGDTDGDDFLIWQSNFGSGAASAAVPEPASIWMWIIGVVALSVIGARRQIVNLAAACLVSFGIANASIADMLVSDYAGGVIQRYDETNGDYLGVFATDAALDSPYGLTFGPDNNLYVASFLTSEILRFDGASGALIDAFASGGGLDHPSGAVFGADGHLYVASTMNNLILRYNGATGAFIDVFASGGGLAFPSGLTFGPDENLYVSSVSTDQILRYDGTTGAFLDVFASGGGLANPMSPKFGPDGNLYVGSFSTNNVLRFDGSTGAFMDVFASDNLLFGPANVDFGPDGALYVPSYAFGAVLRFDGESGAFIDNFTYELGLTTFIALVFTPRTTTPGDFDADGDVDGDDFLTWQAAFGVNDGGDADGDGDTDGDDFLIWQSNFGSGAASVAVPEPSGWALAALIAVAFGQNRCGRTKTAHCRYVAAPD